MGKGIVMDKSRRSMVIMTPEGEFLKLPVRRAARVGQEIEFQAVRSPRFHNSLRYMSGMTAAVVIGLIILSGVGWFGGTEPVAAYVSMDINPSIELGINAQDKVVEAQGINADGARVMASIAYRNRPLNEVAAAIIKQAAADHYLEQPDTDIVITSTVVNQASGLKENAISQEVKQQVEAVVQPPAPTAIRPNNNNSESNNKNNNNKTRNNGDNSNKRSKKAVQKPIPNIHVTITALAAPPSVREEAKSEGISTGKMALQLLAQQQQKYIPLGQLKRQSITEIVKQLGGLDKLFPSNQSISPEQLQQWLQNYKADESSHPKTGKAPQHDQGKPAFKNAKNTQQPGIMPPGQAKKVGETGNSGSGRGGPDDNGQGNQGNSRRGSHREDSNKSDSANSSNPAPNGINPGNASRGGSDGNSEDGGRFRFGIPGLNLPKPETNDRRKTQGESENRSSAHHSSDANGQTLPDFRSGRDVPILPQLLNTMGRKREGSPSQGTSNRKKESRDGGSRTQSGGEDSGPRQSAERKLLPQNAFSQQNDFKQDKPGKDRSDSTREQTGKINSNQTNPPHNESNQNESNKSGPSGKIRLRFPD